MKTQGYITLAALSFRLSLLLLFPWCYGEAVGAEGRYKFDLAGQTLSESLLQFSHQSGLAIVFSEPELRRLESPAITGELSAREALEQLLEGTRFTWRLIDNRIVAIYEADCRDTGSCPGDTELLLTNRLYVPGIEELYVYGSPVTGSRIKRSTLQGAAPVDVISAPDIELTGAQTLGELLRYLPAVAGDAVSTAVANGGDGTATVNLRGLPASSTLVLINGRRIANDGLAGESVDLNSIAPAAVERIEVLKDGASAIYGSDAIAGVVNIIMKKDFYGFLAEQFYGTSERGDGETRTTTVQYGTGFRHGSLFLTASHFDQQEIKARDRKVSRSANGRARGGADLRSSATPSARVTLPGEETLIRDLSSGEYRAATGEDLFDYQTVKSSLVPSERNFLYANVSYDFTEQLTGSLEASYTDNNAEAQLENTPVFTAFERDPITVAADNRYNPFGVDIADVRRRFTELAPRHQQNKSDVTRFAAIVEGLHLGWSWEAYYAYSRSKAKQTFSDLVDADNLRRGVGPARNCKSLATDGCVPVNLFGLPGSIDPLQLEFLQAAGRASGESELEVYSLTATRQLLELPHGPLDFAFGVEYREESTHEKPGRENAIGGSGTIGGANFEATAGNREVREIYAESIVPLWSSPEPGAQLDLELALRWSNYSDFGTTSNPKVALRYQISPEWMLRGSYSEGFRAPTLNELFQGAREEQAFLSDPCSLPENVGVLAGCARLADPTRNQFLTLTRGNRRLEEENAETFGLGVVWTPGYLQGLTLSLDYFDIDTDNIIDSGAQYLVNENAASGAFSDRVTRDEAGNLTLVEATQLNIGERRVRGVDLSLGYRLPNRFWGQWSTVLTISHIDEYSIQLLSAPSRLKLEGTFVDPASGGVGGIPRWKGNFGIQWARQRWRGNYDLHYVSKLEERVPGTSRQRHIDSWLVQDIQVSYVFGILSGLRLSLGVDNLLDKNAPFAASAFNDNIDARTHDLRGRFWYAKLSQRI